MGWNKRVFTQETRIAIAISLWILVVEQAIEIWAIIVQILIPEIKPNLFIKLLIAVILLAIYSIIIDKDLRKEP